MEKALYLGNVAKSKAFLIQSGLPAHSRKGWGQFWG